MAISTMISRPPTASSNEVPHTQRASCFVGASSSSSSSSLLSRPSSPSSPSSSPLLSVLFLLLLSSYVTLVHSVFSCHELNGSTDPDPDSAGITKKLFNEPLATSTTVQLKRAEGDYLCVLFVKSYSEGSEADRKVFYVPVSRSYPEEDGGKWKRAAGRYADAYTLDDGGVEYGSCVDSDPSYCELTLPDGTEEYYVTTYKHSISDRQKWVRFFERASFGASTSMVETELASSDSFKVAAAKWIKKQRDDYPPTSHREYFRKRVNPRSLEMYKYGRTGPHPCRENSRWRKFAFTRKDKVMSTGPIKSDWPMVMHNATLEKITDSGQDYAVWKYDGHIRTVLSDWPKWGDGLSAGLDIPEDTYRVCGVDEVPGSKFADEASRTLYAKFKLQNHAINNVCNHVQGGNPTVELTSFITGVLPPLDFVGESSNLNNIGYDPTGDADSKDDSVKLFTNGNYFSTNNDACNALPDPDKADFRSVGWIYSPYYEGASHPDWDPASRSFLDQPVFAVVPGGANYIHDRRFSALKNTIPEPLENGGGEQTINSVFINVNDHDEDDETLTIVDHDENPRTKSSISGNEQAIFCSNTKPNLFNEANCKLSTDQNACVREGSDDEDTIVVTMFNANSARHSRLSNTENSLARIATYLDDKAIGIPLEVVNLGLDSTLPCVLNTVSRFKRAEGSNQPDCESIKSYQPETGSVFQHLISHSVSDNEFVRDILMHDSLPDDLACHSTDLSATDFQGFGIWVNEECWVHVHPRESNVYLVQDADYSTHGADGKLDFTISQITWDDSLHGTWGSQGQHWGRKGDVRVLSELLNLLGIYKKAGGKDVTAAPTGSPSASPSTTPSTSLVPSASSAPSRITNSPSTSHDPSQEPSVSREPSSSNQPSLLPSTSSAPSTSGMPSSQPSIQPSSASPSTIPSTSLVPSASSAPSHISNPPSTSHEPSQEPSVSREPSSSNQPSLLPSTSSAPSTSGMPSSQPSSQPSGSPSASPSTIPSTSLVPSASSAPSHIPSEVPTDDVTNTPSFGPSVSSIPSTSTVPSSEPSSEPSQISQIARTTNDNIFDLIANDDTIGAVILETELTQKTGGVLVCGSSGEIESDPTYDDYFDYWNWRLDSTPNYSEQKKTVWTNIALTVDDQLCQRTAFSLSQIFAISPGFLGYGSLSEAHMNYYDGFVRNCHSTYKNVFKTVAFSVKMGMQLSHVGSSSVRTSYDSSGRVRFPDENFARESMQLETVGLDMLNMDGTTIKNDLGNPVPTYDTNDILTLARVWTGFTYANRRGNYEENDPIEINWNDPMTLSDIERHDWFPKKDLLDNWIGDHYPLCSDMTVDKPFLKVGATYKLLGRSSAPRYQYDNSAWDGNEVIKKFVLSPTSSGLYDALCDHNGSDCTYPAVVKLTSDVTCNGCDVQTLRVVQVAPNVFYEYVRRPCVHLAFFDGAKSVFAGHGSARMCAHTSSLVATKTCCDEGVSTNSRIECIYHGELVSYPRNEEFCGSSGICPADTPGISIQDNCKSHIRYNSRSPKFNHFHWTSGSCEIKIKVRLDGMVALVHEPESSTAVVRYVENSIRNMNYFHVPWPKDDLGDELFPHVDNACGEETCILQDDWTCLCSVVVNESMGFQANPTDAAEIRSTLRIGAFPPEYLGRYDSGTNLFGGDVTVYHLRGQSYTKDSIFKIPDEYDEFSDFGNEYIQGSNEGVLYLKNLISNIDIGDSSASSYFSPPQRRPLTMRNPVLFHDLVKPEIRDSYYEVDAVIHHLNSHPNAPPFVSNMLIQHFGISNPSPDYIERVATAYKAGAYPDPNSSLVFGDGKFSSLDATVAAILLDQEALADKLDADPAYGGIKEPIIKVLQFMRAMEYTPTHHDRNMYPKLIGMVGKVGQMAYESPDQFSFFLPDYNPPGQFAQSGLFAPPAQVLTLSTTVATIEGFFSLARQGLSSHGEGFGSSPFGPSAVDALDSSRSVGHLDFSFSVSGDVNQNVQEIADLLTAGRLSTAAVEKIATFINNSSEDKKRIITQQLIATSPEFHTTNLAHRTGNKREPTSAQDHNPEPYKAIVVLILSGGLDSFNVLTPHSSCSLYQSYRKNREVLALGDSEMTPIRNDDEDQPCSTFGVHTGIPILKEIYDNGHGQFHANIGHLSKPVTKGNWFTETQTHLFSHKTMEREAQLVDAFQEDGWSTGVCGRMLDVFQRRGLSVAAIGIDGKGPIIEGNPSLGRTVDVISSSGVNTLTRLSLDNKHSNDLSTIEDLMKYLNEETNQTSGVFANYWAQNLVDVLNKTDTLSKRLRNVNVQNGFSGRVGNQLKLVAKMMKLNGADRRSVNRDVFLITNGGHDGHSLSKENLARLLPGINSGISSFYKEMTDTNLLNNVTFVMISEFGRTITPNTGLGSDHAWGGNAFVWGGQIAGSKILGKYPESFDNSDISQIGRGRLIPSRSWESLWYGVSNWFGITDEEEINYVLPNNGNMGCELYTDADMFTVGNTTIKGCNDRSIGMKLSMFLTKPRYLTGIEQKRICKAALFLMVKNANVTSRCVVTDQKVVVSFESARRILSVDDVDTRLLTVGENDNVTVEAGIAFAYDNPPGSLAGSEYVENAPQLTQDMDDLVRNPDCSDPSSSRRRGRRRLDAQCAFAMDIVDEVSNIEAIVTEAPSQFPSTSTEPSSLPSVLPSSQPSENPSISIIPSESPSTSNMPSSQPSISPEASPSESPSHLPSSQPSISPEASPSGSPSISFSPTTSHPSSKPSVAPSSMPTRDCPFVLDECFNGGMWSSFTCECLCVSPYCPDAVDGRCTQTSCPANYHETLFDDQRAPWFEYGSSCLASKSLPSSVDAIYPSEEVCCANEYPDNIDGCISRRAAVSQLTFNGELLLIGTSCSTSGSERASAVGTLASSILSSLCENISGLTCSGSSKVIVNNYCGEDYNSEAVYSSSRRRLENTDDEGNQQVNFAFITQSTDSDEIQGIHSLLSSYLQGTTLNTFLESVKVNVLASNPTSSLQTLSAVTYAAVNAFIAGTGFFYPAWGYLETCISDGNQGPYMNRDHGSWLYGNLISCCQRYYGWDVVGCTQRNAEATLISGTISSIVDPTDILYFPDWERTDTCINGGAAPAYMKDDADLWMYETLLDCCKVHYGWEGGFDSCMSSQGGDPPTRSPISESWYVDWGNFVCVESCEGASPCGGRHEPWDILHGSKLQCCQIHLWWKVDCVEL